MRYVPPDPDQAAEHCRCQDIDGQRNIYLSPFCRYADIHRRLDEYGYPHTVIMTLAAEYHRAWMAGEYNEDLAPQFRPGYRPHGR